MTNQLESGLNFASQSEEFVKIRGSGDPIRTFQSRAVPSAEAVASVCPFRAELSDMICPLCSQLRGSNAASFSEGSTQPTIPSEPAANRRSPNGESASVRIPLRAQSVRDGIADFGKPSGPRFHIESSLAPAVPATRYANSRRFWLSTAIPFHSDTPGRALTFASQILFPLESDQAAHA